MPTPAQARALMYALCRWVPTRGTRLWKFPEHSTLDGIIARGWFGPHDHITPSGRDALARYLLRAWRP